MSEKVAATNEKNADATSRSNVGLAAKIARAIFECGDEPPECGGETYRIEFKGGDCNTEVSMGGLNERGLMNVIKRTLAANMEFRGERSESLGM